MSEPSVWDQQIKPFLTEWLAGLMHGIHTLDPALQTHILTQTGMACARMHATAMFTRSWADTQPSIPAFLAALNTAMHANLFTWVNDHEIAVEYPKCFCPLVRLGLVTSPTLCQCSQAWLQTNFAPVLPSPVQISRIHTVLEGTTTCKFTLHF